MELEGLTAQKVVSRALALSKAPLMLLDLLVNIGGALASSNLNTVAPFDDISVEQESGKD